jgi:hypothetical protein
MGDKMIEGKTRLNAKGVIMLTSIVISLVAIIFGTFIPLIATAALFLIFIVKKINIVNGKIIGYTTFFLIISLLLAALITQSIIPISKDIGITGKIVFDIKDSKGDFVKSSIDKLSGVQTKISFEQGPVDNIVFNDLKTENTENLALGVDETDIEGFDKVYAIDPTQLEFSSAAVTVKSAKGSELYKCKEWNFTEQECHGEWTKIMDITPGQDYTFTLTKDDPGFAEQPGSEGKDAYINSGSATRNYGASTTIDLATTDAKRGLIEFNLSGVPSGATITNATLTLYLSSKGIGASVPVTIQRINNSWTEGTGNDQVTNDGASWNSRNGSVNWNTAGGDFGTIIWANTTVSTQDIFYTWNIANLTQNWINGTYPNYGMMLRTTSGSGLWKFASSEDTNSTRRPMINITYSESALPVINSVSMPSELREGSTLSITINATDNSAVSSALIGINAANYSSSQNAPTGSQIIIIRPSAKGTIETNKVIDYQNAYDSNNNTKAGINDITPLLTLKTAGVGAVGTINNVKIKLIYAKAVYNTTGYVHWAINSSLQGATHAFDSTSESLNQSEFDITSERNWTFADFNLLAEIHVNNSGNILRLYEAWFEVNYASSNSAALWNATIDTSALASGNYNYTIYAQDTSGNIASQTGSFTILPRLVLVNTTISKANGNQEATVEIYNSNNDLEFNGSNTDTSLTSVESGAKEIVINPVNNTIQKIEIYNASINSDTNSIVRIDNPSNSDYLQTYAIDPTALNFTSANVTVTAAGNELYKCKNWNFTSQACIDGIWTLFKTDLIPGQAYSFTLTADDPGFGETTVLKYILHNESDSQYSSYKQMKNVSADIATVRSEGIVTDFVNYTCWNSKWLAPNWTINTAINGTWNFSIYTIAAGQPITAAASARIFKYNATSPNEFNISTSQATPVAIAKNAVQVFNWSTTVPSGAYTNLTAGERVGIQVCANITVAKAGGFFNMDIEQTTPSFVIFPNTSIIGGGPTVNLVSPKNGNVTTINSITFTCNATTAALLTNITFYWNYSGSFIANATVNVTGTFNQTSFNRTNLANGAILWNCLACDNNSACSFAPADYTATVNVSAPGNTAPYNITLNQPLNSTQFNNTQNIAFNFTAYDLENATLNCSIYLDSVLNQTNSTTRNATLTNFAINGISYNNHNWFVNCSDFSLSNVSETRTFTIADTINPAINFTSPSEVSGSFIGRRNVLANVTASDSGAGLKNITIYLFNSTGVLINSSGSTTNPLFSNFSVSADGIFYFNSTAYDNSGNSNSTETRNVTIDTLNPAIAITYPANQSYNINVSALNYTVSDANLQACWYSLNNGVTNTTLTCGNNLTNMASTEGSNTWLVGANDSAGNQNLSRVTFSKDTINPSIIFANPTQNSSSFISRNNFLVNVSANDTNLANISLRLYNATALINTTNTTSTMLYINYTALNDGIYYFNATAYDTAGNLNSTETRNVTIDTLNPAINFTSPSETSGSSVNRRYIKINVTATDANLNNITVYLYNATALINTTSSASNPLSLNFTVSTDGIYYFNATAYDSLNHYNNTETRNVTIDTRLPSVTINSPLNAAYSNATITVDIMAINIQQSGIDKIWYNWNGTNVTYTNPINVTFNNGSNTLYAYANDTAGNIGTNNVTFTVDTIAPAYSNNKTSPSSPANYASGQNYQFNITWIDSGAGVQRAILSFNGTNYTMSNLSSEYYYTLSNLAAGTYAYYFWANDSAGNANQTPVLNYLINTASQSITPLLNGNNANLTVIYPQQVNASYTGTNQTAVSIKVNGTSVNIAQNYTFGAGAFDVNYSMPANQNYSAFEAHLNLTINQASGAGTLLLNGTAGNINFAYPGQVNASFTNSTGTGTLLRNSAVDITNLNNQYQDLAVGYYNFTLNVAGNQNYSAFTLSRFANVTIATPSLSLLNTTAFTVTYPTQTNISGIGCPAQLTCILYRDNVNVSSPDVNTFGVNNYTYVYNTTGNENYTSASANATLIINKTNSIVYTYLNNSRSNITIKVYGAIWLNSTLQQGEGAIQLFLNNSLINSGSSALSNYTVFNSFGLYNITTSYAETQNYTSSSETFWVNVIDLTPPEIQFVIPTTASGNYSQNWIAANVTARDNISLSVITVNLYNLTGSVNSTISAASPLFINFTGLADGNYYLNATANDSSGNVNSTETRTIMLDTIYPALSFVHPTENAGNYINRNDAKVNISVSDANFRNVTINLYNSTGLKNSTALSANPAYIDFAGLSDGIYYFNATACDAVNNCNSSATVNVTIDTVLPTFNVIQTRPAPGSLIVFNAPVTLKANATDNNAVTSVNATVTWNANSQVIPLPFNIVTGLYEAIFSNTTELMNYNVVFNATDIAGNSNITSTNFTVYTNVPPVITYTNISNYAPVINETIILDMNATDAVAVDLKYINITLPNGTIQTYYTVPLNFNVTLAGRHNVTFIANNSAGLIAAASDYFIAGTNITVQINVISNNNTGVDTTLTIFLPGTNKTVHEHNFTGTFVDYHAAEVYDFLFSAFNDSLEVTLREVNLSIDSNNTLGLDKLPVPESGFLITYGINNTYTIANASVKIFYGNLTYSNENNLGLYRCSDWDFANRACLSSWLLISAIQNTTSKIFSVDVSGFSGYSIKESIPSPPVTPSAGGGGGGYYPTKCVENWSCSEWICADGSAERTCADLNKCGTILYKPIESAECSKVPRCFDRIKDGIETDVDCGGNCAPCLASKSCIVDSDCITRICYLGVCVREKPAQPVEKPVFIPVICWWIWIFVLLIVLALLLILNLIDSLIKPTFTERMHEYIGAKKEHGILRPELRRIKAEKLITRHPAVKPEKNVRSFSENLIKLIKLRASFKPEIKAAKEEISQIKHEAKYDIKKLKEEIISTEQEAIVKPEHRIIRFVEREEEAIRQGIKSGINSARKEAIVKPEHRIIRFVEREEEAIRQGIKSGISTAKHEIILKPEHKIKRFIERQEEALEEKRKEAAEERAKRELILKHEELEELRERKRIEEERRKDAEERAKSFRRNIRKVLHNFGLYKTEAEKKAIEKEREEKELKAEEEKQRIYRERIKAEHERRKLEHERKRQIEAEKKAIESEKARKILILNEERQKEFRENIRAASEEEQARQKEARLSAKKEQEIRRQAIKEKIFSDLKEVYTEKINATVNREINKTRWLGKIELAKQKNELEEKKIEELKEKAEESRSNIKNFFHSIGLYKTEEEKKAELEEKEQERQKRLQEKVILENQRRASEIERQRLEEIRRGEIEEEKKRILAERLRVEQQRKEAELERERLEEEKRQKRFQEKLMIEKQRKAIEIEKTRLEEIRSKAAAKQRLEIERAKQKELERKKKLQEKIILENQKRAAKIEEERLREKMRKRHGEEQRKHEKRTIEIRIAEEEEALQEKLNEENMRLKNKKSMLKEEEKKQKEKLRLEKKRLLNEK